MPYLARSVPSVAGAEKMRREEKRREEKRREEKRREEKRREEKRRERRVQYTTTRDTGVPSHTHTHK
jgi:hypothetical protein